MMETYTVLRSTDHKTIRTIAKRIPLDIGKTKEGQISDIAPAMTNDSGISIYDIDVDIPNTLPR